MFKIGSHKKSCPTDLKTTDVITSKAAIMNYPPSSNRSVGPNNYILVENNTQYG